MKASVMYEAEDVHFEDVPNPTIVEPTDAYQRLVRACVCGRDLHPYHQMERSEAVGVVEDTGSDVQSLKTGDVVVPFAFSDGTCAFCREGLHTACVHGGFFGNNGVNGAQAEALRFPQVDGTLFKLPAGEDDELMPSLLNLSEVMGTVHHAAVVAGVGYGKSVAVVGTAPLACAASSLPSALARSRSSSWAATTTASSWQKNSARQTW